MPKAAAYRALCLLLILLPLAACKKLLEDPRDSDGLPPATQEGANTMGALIDGKPWISDRCRGNNCPPNPSFYTTYGLFVTGRGMDRIIRIELRGINRVGTFSLDTLPVFDSGSVDWNVSRISIRMRSSLEVASYWPGTYCRGQVQVTRWFRGTQNEYPFSAGTFWFDLYDPARWPDTIRVRKGRWDVRMM